MDMMQTPQSLVDETMNLSGLVGGDSLDDIIMQNNRETYRRQSMGHIYGQSLDRRSSMIEFGTTHNGLSGFQFAPNAINGSPGEIQGQTPADMDLTRYQDLGSRINMPEAPLGFTTSMQTPGPLAIDTTGFSVMSPEMLQGVVPYSPMAMEEMTPGSSAMNLFSQHNFTQSFSNSIDAMPGNFVMSGTGRDGMSHHRGSLPEDDIESPMNPGMSSLGASEESLVSSPVNLSMNMNMSQNMTEFGSPMNSNISLYPGKDSPYSQREATASPVAEVEVVPKPEPEPTQYKNIYSSSGFDMLGALMKVASRKNPEINIGKVDMSCAFVVCDLTQPDCPITYVSDIFERLTGYTKFEVLGRNCRFLQSPDGKVQAGVRRDFVDNDSVYYLRSRINAKKEAQRSLINYRKGGQPFMNLLTMIPITGEDDTEIKYYVGFQVDLVEKPTSVEAKGVNGMYTVDYTQGSLPQYTWQPPESLRHHDEGQTLSRDDVSMVLSSINNRTESEMTKRMWDKVLLENTDDVVHVLSLKGLFLYLSPSCRHVLEYDPSELMGTTLSSICHPSDIIPVTRELKDTSTGAAVSVVFRIRRKKSGYTWFESHGSLCVEPGKGRKFIILVGRERPVYALNRNDIDGVGGIGENEIWAKLSTSGMFLFVSSNVKTILDRPPEDLIGTSIQVLMRSEPKIEFNRCLEKARTGKRVSYQHEIFNKRGLGLMAETTLYSGDACEGSKPTFLVAQTRLLKSSSRNVPLTYSSHSNPHAAMSQQHPLEDALSQPSGLTTRSSNDGESTPRSNASVQGPVTQAGGAGLPIGTQDQALAAEENIFDELKTTRSTSWQYELRQMEKSNRSLAEELAMLIANKKKRKRRKGSGHLQRDCANCHTRSTPEWRRGPSGARDLCNSCGLRWAKSVSRSSSDCSSMTNSSKNSPMAL
jgi:PAS domain S-box-containing protein